MTFGSQSFDSTSICLSTREKAYATRFNFLCDHYWLLFVSMVLFRLYISFQVCCCPTSCDLREDQGLHVTSFCRRIISTRVSGGDFKICMFCVPLSFWDHVPAWYLSKRTPAVSVAITWSEPAMTSTYPVYIYIIIEHNLIIIFLFLVHWEVALSWRLEKRQTGGGSTWIICSPWLPPCHCLQDQRAEGNAHLILATKWTVQRAPWRHRASGVSGVSERMDNDSFELHMLPQVAGLENI